MKLKWLGHSSFLLTSNRGVKLLTDPYRWLFPFFRYKPIRMAVDIVTMSHRHFYHSKTWGLSGQPVVIRERGAFSPKGIEVVGISSFHDDFEGKKRGPNIIYRIAMDDIFFCHLGDLGHILTASQVGQVGKVDVLMAPVGGIFTARTEAIEAVCLQLKPRVIIPMHFRTRKTLLPIRNAESFIKRWDQIRVQRLNLSELEFRRGDMVEGTHVWLMKHAN